MTRESQQDSKFSDERRTVLKIGILGLAQHILLPRYAHAVLAGGEPNPSGNLEYYLRDKPTELLLTLEARGFQERGRRSRRYLRRNGSSNPLLIVTFPPQHYLETAIPFTKLLPPDGKLTQTQIDSLKRWPSQPTRLVFRPTTEFKKLELKVEKLLKWKQLELVLPDHDSYGEYVPGKPYDDNDPKTYIEVPWGVVFTPKYSNPAQINWIQQKTDAPAEEWKPIWNMVFKDPGKSIDLAGVTGFDATDRPNDKTINVKRDGSLPNMANADKNVPLTNINRLEIIASLSGRFPYTGKPDPLEETVTLNYRADGDAQDTKIRACYESGRELGIRTLILSSKGAWLEVDSSWEVPPGCALTSWTHSSAMGRDQRVKLEYKGYLYPFGTQATLIIQSERVFLKDPAGVYIAVLIKQAYLEIPQPNAVSLQHPESPLRYVSVTTKRTPPLDLPPTGDPGDWAKKDFFTPFVDGAAFKFAHTGADWASTMHQSSMEHIFVNNQMRSANGRIWEPGYTKKDGTTWSLAEANASARSANPDVDTAYTVTVSRQGLREVDKEWMKQPFRFTSYGGRRMALAQPLDEGDTSQRVEWIEWARGPIGALSEGPKIVDPPFVPRLRTAKIQLESTGSFSGNSTFVIGTCRDTRFVNKPFLDPEPNTTGELYSDNLVDTERLQKESIYFHLLETHQLVDVPANSDGPSEQQIQQQILDAYYGTAATNKIPISLFGNTRNEVVFGVDTPTDKSGALAIPDTHAVGLSRQYGVVGDATFNIERWRGIDYELPKLKARSRLDFSKYRQVYRKNLDQIPFDATNRKVDRDQQIDQARSVMGFDRAGVAAAAPAAELMSLGEVFGAGAEIIPGISFAKVFESILLDDGISNASVAPHLFLNADGRPKPSASPFQWKLSVTGIDWLLDLIGDGPDQISLPELITIAKAHGQELEVSVPVEIGFSASVNWETRNFPSDDIDFGLAIFRAKEGAAAKVNAKAESSTTLDQVLGGGSSDAFGGLLPKISSVASVENVAVEVFRAIEVAFSKVTFELQESGDKTFDVTISDITLKGPLAFINQLADAMSSVGDDYGIDIDISIDQVLISQTLKFPKNQNQPLFIGPAQVIDLAMGWAVRVPLVGRDVISVSFAISSRRRPLTIYVPPWYGGKAYFLIELTTKGVRMLEVSMEYGALVPITWGIATGQAYFTAGLFYGVYKRIGDSGELTQGSVTYTAFIKAGANLDVASVIHFSGLIYIGLTVESSQSEGDTVKGESTISVSIKIGFVRLSYSFTAAYEEGRGGNQSLVVPAAQADRNFLPMSTNIGFAVEQDGANQTHISIYGRPLSDAQQDALARIINGYQ